MVFYADFYPAEKPEEKIDAPKEILEIANARWEAKKAKNYALADELRGKALAEGWVILDKKDGFDIKKA